MLNCIEQENAAWTIPTVVNMDVMRLPTQHSTHNVGTPLMEYLATFAAVVIQRRGSDGMRKERERERCGCGCSSKKAVRSEGSRAI